MKETINDILGIFVGIPICLFVLIGLVKLSVVITTNYFLPFIIWTIKFWNYS